MADRPEKLNERYTLWEKIASGGMADVYRATEYGAKGSSKTVALKKILSNWPQVIGSKSNHHIYSCLCDSLKDSNFRMEIVKNNVDFFKNCGKAAHILSALS